MLLLGFLHSSWPWKMDATVAEDYALMMMMNIREQILHERDPEQN